MGAFHAAGGKSHHALGQQLLQCHPEHGADGRELWRSAYCFAARLPRLPRKFLVSLLKVCRRKRMKIIPEVNISSLWSSPTGVVFQSMPSQFNPGVSVTSLIELAILEIGVTFIINSHHNVFHFTNSASFTRIGILKSVSNRFPCGKNTTGLYWKYLLFMAGLLIPVSYHALYNVLQNYWHPLENFTEMIAWKEQYRQ